MRQFSLKALVFIVVLATAPVAKADTFDFSFTDGTVSGSGTLTGTWIATGTWQLTAGTGTFNDGSGSGPINLVGNPNYPSSTTVPESNPANNFVYDDQLTLFNGPNQYLDQDGLYFAYNSTSGMVDLNLYQTGGGPGADGWYEGNGSGDTAGTFRITSYNIPPSEVVAEPGTLLLMVIGLLGPGIALYRKSERSFSAFKS